MFGLPGGVSALTVRLSQRMSGFSAVFPATQNGVNSFHVFCSSTSRAMREDKGACEASFCRDLSVSLLVSMMVSKTEAGQEEGVRTSTLTKCEW